MNKFFAMVLAVVLALTPTAFAESIDLTGTWVLEKVFMGDIESSPSLFGLSITLELKDDGSFVLFGYTREMAADVNGTWAMEDNICVLTNQKNGSVINSSFSAEDSKLVIPNELFTMVLAREDDVENASPAPLPSTVAAESEAAFFGTWRMYASSFNGIYFPLPDIDTNETLILDSGTCIMIIGGVNESILNTRFKDGGLSLYNYEYSYDVATPGTLWLMEDGTLSLPTEYGYTYYFSKVE